MIIAGTGHRPDKLPLGYHPSMMRVMKRTIRSMLPDDVTEIISGMALGWDTALALVALEEGIPLVAAIPFVGQESRWKEADQKVHRQIVRRANRVVIVSKGGYSPAKMQTRNMWMVDAADRVLALWEGSDGGTANCVRYAEGEGRPVTNCWSRFMGIHRGSPMEFALHPESESGVIFYGEDEFDEMWRGACGTLDPVLFRDYKRARAEGWQVDWVKEWDLI